MDTDTCSICVLFPEALEVLCGIKCDFTGNKRDSRAENWNSLRKLALSQRVWKVRRQVLPVLAPSDVLHRILQPASSLLSYFTSFSKAVLVLNTNWSDKLCFYLVAESKFAHSERSKNKIHIFIILHWNVASSHTYWVKNWKPWAL